MDKLTANNLTNESVAQRLDIGTTITDTSSPDPSPNTVWSKTVQDTLATDNSYTIAPKEHDRHTLELLAERPLIDIQRVVTGNVKFSKQVRTQTVNVPVTLRHEELVVEETKLDTPQMVNRQSMTDIAPLTNKPNPWFK